jgi:hypothetical protein
VDLLGKSDLNGMKRATDAAFRLAAWLLGVRLNFQAGAVRCDEAGAGQQRPVAA